MDVSFQVKSIRRQVSKLMSQSVSDEYGVLLEVIDKHPLDVSAGGFFSLNKEYLVTVGDAGLPAVDKRKMQQTPIYSTGIQYAADVRIANLPDQRQQEGN